MSIEHEKYMKMALIEAKAAAAEGEVPVGALIVKDGIIISKAHNRRENENRAIAHAEILAIDEACLKLEQWRLVGCTLYVTLEPCLMCSGAIVNSRVDSVVYGATDPKAGAVESLYQSLCDARLNHRPQVFGGILAEESSQILKDFFRARR